MTIHLDRLQITPAELEQITGLEISETFMGRVYRPSLFRNRPRLLSFLLTEALGFGLLLIFCLPVGIVLARGLGLSTGGAESALPFLAITLSGAIALFALWNGWMWRQTRRFRMLADLLDDVDQHNEIIQAVRILDELSTIQPESLQVVDRQDVVQALSATRESLLSALMTERILRKHQPLVARRSDLFQRIEQNLTTLRTLQVNHQASDYGDLLNQALQIGISVQRAIEAYPSRR